MDKTYRVVATTEYFVNAASEEEAASLVLDKDTYDDYNIISFSVTEEDEEV